MGLLIPVLFVTCPATRDSDSAVPVSTPEARALGKVSKGPSWSSGSPGDFPIPPLLPSFPPATLPDTQSQVHTNCINLCKVQTLSRPN